MVIHYMNYACSSIIEESVPIDSSNNSNITRSHTQFPTQKRWWVQRVLIQENLKDISADVQCLVAIWYMIPIDNSIIQ